MPIPKPATNESRPQFISRCMSDQSMREEYSVSDQRVAVCTSAWNSNKTGNSIMYTKMVPVKIKSVDDNGEFQGYGSVFGNVDHYGDIVEKGAFKRTIKNNKGVFPLLWQHNQNQPIGTLEVTEDDKGLKVVGRLALAVQQSKEAYELLKIGALDGLSIGYTVIKDSFDKNTGIRYLKEVKLFEVSIVTFPANTAATVTAVKSLFDNLDEQDRVKVIDYIKSLQDEGDSEIKDQDDHSITSTVLDNNADDSELIHSLEQLSNTIRGN